LHQRSMCGAAKGSPSRAATRRMMARQFSQAAL
jgi:hypothetical protein